MNKLFIKSVKITHNDHINEFEFSENSNIILGDSTTGKSLVFKLILMGMGSKDLFEQTMKNKHEIFDAYPEELYNGIQGENIIIIKNKEYNQEQELKVVWEVNSYKNDYKTYINGVESNEEEVLKLYKTFFKTPSIVKTELMQKNLKITVKDYLMLMFIRQKEMQSNLLTSTIYPNQSVKTKYAIMLLSAAGQIDELIDKIDENYEEMTISKRKKLVEDVKDYFFDKDKYSEDFEDRTNFLLNQKSELLKEKNTFYRLQRRKNITKFLFEEILNDKIIRETLDNESIEKISNWKAAKIINNFNTLESIDISSINEKLMVINEKIYSHLRQKDKNKIIYDFLNGMIDEKVQEKNKDVEKIEKEIDSQRIKLAKELRDSSLEGINEIYGKWASQANLSNRKLSKIYSKNAQFTLIDSEGLEKIMIVLVAFLSINITISKAKNNVHLPMFIDSLVETDTSLSDSKKQDLFTEISNTFNNKAGSSQTILLGGADNFSEKMSADRIFILKPGNQKQKFLSNGIIDTIKNK